jgi:3-oxoacyl-[acyl-carrier protein] reductase
VSAWSAKFVSYYTMVKYAELGLMPAAAAEYASSKVRINGISRSTVDTKLLQKEVDPQMATAAIPLGRNATPQDLIGAIEFLLSSGAEYLIDIDILITAGITC